MPRAISVGLALILGLTLAAAGQVHARAADPFLDKLIQSYDLLEAGKLDEARKIYDELLKTRPGDPLVLNNLAALLVKQGKLAEAREHLEKALPKAKGYKVRVNRVCDVDGICLAFRP